MANISVGFLSVFNHEEQEWLLHKDRLEHWFIANDINVDTDKSGAKRRDVLLISLAEPTYRLVKNLALPAKVGTLEFKKLTDLLDGHFKPTKCGFAERFKFYSAVQSSGESLADWAARVRGLSLYCNFVAASLEESLRDRFVLGMAGGPERDRLFREPLNELTLAKALQLAESIRCAREGAQQTTTVAAAPTPALDVLKMSARPPGPQAPASATRQNGVPQASTSRDQKSAVQCSVCGNFNHKSKKCRFKNASCKLCGVKGHLMRVCNAKNAQVNQNSLQCCSDDVADDGKQEYSSRTLGATWGIITAVMLPIVIVLICVGWRILKRRKAEEKEEIDYMIKTRALDPDESVKVNSDDESIPYKKESAEDSPLPTEPVKVEDGSTPFNYGVYPAQPFQARSFEPAEGYSAQPYNESGLPEPEIGLSEPRVGLPETDQSKNQQRPWSGETEIN